MPKVPLLTTARVVEATKSAAPTPSLLSQDALISLARSFHVNEVFDPLLRRYINLESETLSLAQRIFLLQTLTQSATRLARYKEETPDKLDVLQQAIASKPHLYLYRFYRLAQELYKARKSIDVVAAIKALPPRTQRFTASCYRWISYLHANHARLSVETLTNTTFKSEWLLEYSGALMLTIDKTGSRWREKVSF
jgi:hypothetical protein